MIDSKYSEYLQSEAWQRKRFQRLSISKFKCAACGSDDRLEVHHLTYARIYSEDMEDLLPLCWLHHKAAEELVAKGVLPRTGDVIFLATETIRLICGGAKKQPRHKTVGNKDVQIRNRVQEGLVCETWFVDALKKGRNEFGNLVRRKFEGHPIRCRMIANAFTIYDRMGNQWRKLARKGIMLSNGTNGHPEPKLLSVQEMR